MNIIETERFILKKVEKKYLKEIFNILSNPNVIKNLNLTIHTKIKDTEKLLNDYYDGLEKKEKFPYEIIDKKNNNFIGIFLIKLDLYNEDSFEFTIYIDEKYWNRGIYSEILPYMTDFTFNEIGVKNFRGFVKEKNKASMRVLEKTGFKLENKFYVDGIPEMIYSYIKLSDK